MKNSNAKNVLIILLILIFPITSVNADIMSAFRRRARNTATANTGDIGTVQVRSYLNVRTSPWGTIIGRLYNNDKVKILGRKGKWYKIYYEGKVAYAYSKYIKRGFFSSGKSSSFSSSNSTGKVQIGYVRVRTRLNVRTMPWGRIIGGLTNGTKITIIGKTGQWYKIRYKGQVAYVHSSYVSTSKPGPGSSKPGSSSQGSSTPNIDSNAPLLERIQQSALSRVNKPFKYHPLTKGGRLGCAQVVTTILKDAGALNRISLGVLESKRLLKARGWREVKAPPFRKGDVVCWRTYIKTRDSHIGVVVKSGGKFMVVDNSSSRRRPVLRSIYTHGSPTTVLRAPV